jgi:hypothetical protein
VEVGDRSQKRAGNEEGETRVRIFQIPPILPLAPEFLTSSTTSIVPSSYPTNHACPEHFKEGVPLTFAPDVTREVQLLLILSQNITGLNMDEVCGLNSFLS